LTSHIIIFYIIWFISVLLISIDVDFCEIFTKFLYFFQSYHLLLYEQQFQEWFIEFDLLWDQPVYQKKKCRKSHFWSAIHFLWNEIICKEKLVRGSINETALFWVCLKQLHKSKKQTAGSNSTSTFSWHISTIR
jgi:hypothetical protein